MESLKIGETVQLRSGGPLMTILEEEKSVIDGKLTGNLVCVWFDSKHQPQKQSFPPAVLEKSTGLYL